MIKIPRNSSDFSTLDEHLETEGKREDFQAVAIKEVLAWQIEQAMKAQKLSRTLVQSRWRRTNSVCPSLRTRRRGAQIWNAPAPRSSRVFNAMAVEVAVIVTDTPPLIALAAFPRRNSSAFGNKPRLP